MCSDAAETENKHPQEFGLSQDQTLLCLSVTFAGIFTYDFKLLDYQKIIRFSSYLVTQTPMYRESFEWLMHDLRLVVERGRALPGIFFDKVLDKESVEI